MQNTKSLIVVLMFAISSAFFIGADLLEPKEAAEACAGIRTYFDEKKGECVSTHQGISGSSLGKDGLQARVSPIVNTVAAVLLSFGVLNIIYGGLEFILSGMNESRAESAKKRLLYTFISMVFLLSIYSIYRLSTSLIF